MLRTFILDRKIDVSGVSGCGAVAEGCLFDSGEAVVHWKGEHASINIYHSLEDVLAVHSHGGATVVVFDDERKPNN